MGEIKGRLSYSANRRNETGGVYSIAEGKILLPEGHDVKAGDVFTIADLRIVIRSVKEVKDFDGKTVLTGAYT